MQRDYDGFAYFRPLEHCPYCVLKGMRGDYHEKTSQRAANWPPNREIMTTERSSRRVTQTTRLVDMADEILSGDGGDWTLCKSACKYFITCISELIRCPFSVHTVHCHAPCGGDHNRIFRKIITRTSQLETRPLDWKKLIGSSRSAWIIVNRRGYSGSIEIRIYVSSQTEAMTRQKGSDELVVVAALVYSNLGVLRSHKIRIDFCNQLIFLSLH